jgi:glycosyltransferase involved in cell wall biosynthesis
MTDTRPVVLILLGCFRRGFEATGPNQSAAGMVAALSDRFRFRIIGEESDEDEPGRWTSLAGIEQLPLAAGHRGARGLGKAIRETPHDLLITNGFFDRMFTLPMLGLRRMGRIPRRPTLLAPRGEFAPGALGLSAGRKRAYLGFARAGGLLRGVTMQATGENEAADIRAVLGPETPVVITPNLRAMPPLPPHPPRGPDQPLRIAFLSRIDRMKKLDFALDLLADAGVPASFDIYGPVMREAYWQTCLDRIAALPPQVRATWHGAIPQADVIGTLARHDLFLLPTRGENFGHAIADALSAGTPVLISDKTPWRGLTESGAGWDLPLARPDLFIDAIRAASRADPAEAAARRRAARARAEAACDTERDSALLAQSFERLISGASLD